MATTEKGKSERITIRTSSEVRELLRAAAQGSHKSISEFLLDAGVAAANQALAERRHFQLTDEQWEIFEQALDRPVSESPGLRRLLKEPGMLD